MKKCLIISYFFPPHNGIQSLRIYKFCKYLHENGWYPIVLTSDYYDPISLDDNLLKELKGNCIIYRTKDIRNLSKNLVKKNMDFQNINYSKKKLKNQSSLSLIKEKIIDFIAFPDAKIGWTYFAIKQAKKIIKEEHINLVYATGYPWTSFRIAYKISQRYKVPFVCDFRDPWSLSTEVPKWNTQRHSKLERKIVNNSSACIFTTENALEQYKDKYQDNVKFSFIPNGYDHKEYEIKTKLECVKKSGFVIAHTGSLFSSKVIPPENNKRNPYYYLLALEKLKEKHSELYNKISTKFIGGISDVYIELINKKELDNIEIIPQITRSEIIKEQYCADVLLLLVAEKNTSVISSKVYEYIAVSKPILAIIPKDSEIYNLLIDYPLAYCCDIDDVDGIVNTILEISKIIKNSKNYNSEKFKKQFKRQEQTSKLAEIFNNITN